MARFLETSNIIINTDYIAVVQKVSKDHLIVTMKDGEVIHLPGYLVSRISGADAIRQVVPVQNVFAVCNNDGKEERYSVGYQHHYSGSGKEHRRDHLCAVCGKWLRVFHGRGHSGICGQMYPQSETDP